MIILKRTKWSETIYISLFILPRHELKPFLSTDTLLRTESTLNLNLG